MGQIKKYSFILPVRNGGEYVKECVLSILNQELQNFNLIVLDNNSSDGTVQWINSLRDDRIVIYMSDKDLSIEENWARAVTVETNEFVTLTGHDDIFYPDYLETIDKLIAAHPKASLYQTHFNYIDAHGKLISNSRPMQPTETAPEFLEKIFRQHINITGTGFLMRAVDYKKFGGIPVKYPKLLFADFELWLNLTSISYKATSSENCFAFRLHQSTTSTSSDINLNKAFGIFIQYLSTINHNPEIKKVISNNAYNYMLDMCRSFCHRLLRTRIKYREGLTVKQLVNTFNNYTHVLLQQPALDISLDKQIKIATLIDSNFITRYSFLLLKRVYKKPIIKKFE